MSDQFRVTENSELLVFLNNHLKGWARTKIKQRLRTGCVNVNGHVTTQHDYGLLTGDRVEVSASVEVENGKTNLLDIVYQDRDIIAINKPAGLLSVGNAKETQQHALAILRRQLSRRSLEIKLWPVHRIDRDTSGVLLFATSREMREGIMAKWDSAKKEYLAVVVGQPKPAAGTINQPLRIAEHEYRMEVGAHPDAKVAITHYRTQRTTVTRALLEVSLETGRQHQIRAHLSWLGYPVVGDPRYGVDGPRMGLHALRLQITKPNSHKELTFETPVPASFLALLI